jgi:hypothetical protein
LVKPLYSIKGETSIGVVVSAPDISIISEFSEKESLPDQVIV